MAPRKAERLLNLTICLLSTRRYVSRAQVRASVEGYSGLSDAAFERQFERDKDELRGLGVPIETGHNELLFDDEPGYRIRRTDFELPPVELTADEATVVGLATQVWEQTRLAESTANALAKLRAAGVEPDTARLAALSPHVAAREPAFDRLWDATLSRTRVTFGYPGGLSVRTVEPWSVLSRKGSWYLLGYDLDRGDHRMFKMSRMTSVPRPVSPAGAFTVPSDLDVPALAASLEPTAPDADALIAIRGESAPVLRRAGRPVSIDVQVPDEYTVYRVPFAQRGDIVGTLAAAGPDALVLEPAELRAHVVAHLRDVVSAHGRRTAHPSPGAQRTADAQS